MRPDGKPFAPERAEVVLERGGARIRSAAVKGEQSVRFAGLEPAVYTARVVAKGCEHRQQELDLSNVEQAAPGPDGSDPSGPWFEERLYLWPRDWVAVVVETPDGRSFEELAKELGLEPKRLFVGAFYARAQLDPPSEGTWPEERAAKLATFRPPPVQQSWSLPGSCVGSLELEHPPPLWVGLEVLGVPLGWELLPPGATEVVFRFDAAALRDRFAKLTLRVVGAGDLPLSEARVTLKADTSAHRRADLADVAPQADGTVELERLVPGEYELAVTCGEAVHQERLGLDPGEHRDLGDIELSGAVGLEVQVVFPGGEPAVVWIELAPYREGGLTEVGPASRRESTLRELYPPNLWRHAFDGRYTLPMPSAVSIVRARRLHLHAPGWSPVCTPNVRVDPDHPPAGPLVLTALEPVETRFETSHPDAAAIHVLDELELVVHEIRLDLGEPRRASLVPGTYRARLFGGAGAVLDEVPFAVAGEALAVRLR